MEIDFPRHTNNRNWTSSISRKWSIYPPNPMSTCWQWSDTVWVIMLGEFYFLSFNDEAQRSEPYGYWRRWNNFARIIQENRPISLHLVALMNLLISPAIELRVWWFRKRTWCLHKWQSEKWSSEYNCRSWDDLQQSGISRRRWTRGHIAHWSVRIWGF